MKNILIAIDGESGAGKGTLSAGLSKHYGLPLLDTGLLYRFVAYEADRLNINTDEDSEAVRSQLFEISKSITLSDLRLMEEKNKLLRSENIALLASRVSKVKQVRVGLLDIQRSFGKNGAVIDGRDIGTVVFKNADIKFFVDAELSIRATRRFEEIKSKEAGIVVKEDIVNSMKERDFNDFSRAFSPMIPAKDAIIIDTTNLTAKEVLCFAINAVDKKLFS